eukprot:264611_1
MAFKLNAEATPFDPLSIPSDDQPLDSNHEHKLQFVVTVQSNLHISNACAQLDAAVTCETTLKCHGFHHCDHLTRLSNIMKLYACCINSKMKMNYHDLNAAEILTDFLHLLHFHNQTDHEFECIYKQFGGYCNIYYCTMWRRNNRHRSGDYNEYSIYGVEMDAKLIILQQIVDKIHSFYLHCFDAGYKLKNNEKNQIAAMVKYLPADDAKKWFSLSANYQMIIHLMQNKMKYSNCTSNRSLRFNQWDQYKMYSTGLQFEYNNPYAKKGVQPKFQNLKEELLFNSLCRITSLQFDMELHKANIHHDSFHNTKYSQLSVTYIVSIMFYCNYTELQYQLTKTFRNKHVSQVARNNHANFYFWARNLKEAVSKCGTSVVSYEKCYHGIGELVQFDFKTRPFSRIRLSSPTSTSSSFEVALNFTNGNGIVVEFGSAEAMKRGNQHAMHLAVSWISDYAAEKEKLFFGDCYLQVRNIIATKTSCEYKNLLRAINIIDNCVRCQNFKTTKNLHVPNTMQRLCHSLLSHELSYYLSEYKPSTSLYNDPYASNMLHTYCANLPTLVLNYNLLQSDVKFGWFLNSFCGAQIHLVKIDLLSILFPQSKSIQKVNNIKLSSSILDSILKCLGDCTHRIVDNIRFSAPQRWDNSDYVKWENMYKQSFNQIGWQFSLFDSPSIALRLIKMTRKQVKRYLKGKEYQKQKAEKAFKKEMHMANETSK